jgi:hypothetical protein
MLMDNLLNWRNKTSCVDAVGAQMRYFAMAPIRRQGLTCKKRLPLPRFSTAPKSTGVRPEHLPTAKPIVPLAASVTPVTAFGQRSKKVEPKVIV